MAQIRMGAGEPLKVLHLMEEMFPGIELKPMKDMLQGVEMTGEILVTKKLTDPNETLMVKLTLDPVTPAPK